MASPRHRTRPRASSTFPVSSATISRSRAPMLAMPVSAAPRSPSTPTALPPAAILDPTPPPTQADLALAPGVTRFAPRGSHLRAARRATALAPRPSGRRLRRRGTASGPACARRAPRPKSRAVRSTVKSLENSRLRASKVAADSAEIEPAPALVALEDGERADVEAEPGRVDDDLASARPTSRRPRLRPWPAIGCTPCAASPTSAKRSATMARARCMSSGQAARAPTSSMSPSR